MELKTYPSIESLSIAAAAWISELSAKAIAARGRFTLALSGGETPKTLYETLAKGYAEKIDWSRVHLFWGDERFVRHDDPASNYRMVKESLIDNIEIPEQNIHPVAYLSDASDSSNSYAQELDSFFKSDIPSFDLILLGLGGDGHTASLFPGMTVEEMSDGIAITTHSPAAPPIRISLTLPVINGAQNVAFLVSGSGKRDILQSVLADRNNSSTRYPASRINPPGTLIWFVDEAAYKKILTECKN